MSNQIEEKCTNICYPMDNIGIDAITTDFGCCLDQTGNTILTSWKTNEENVLPWYNNTSSGNNGNNNGIIWSPEVNNGSNNGSSWSPEVNNGESNNNNTSLSGNNGNNGSSNSIIWLPEVNNGESNNNNTSLSGNNGGTSWSPEVNNGSNNGSSWSPEVNNGESNNNNTSLSGNNGGTSWSPEVNNNGSSWSPEVNNNGSSWSPEVNNNGSSWSPEVNNNGSSWSPEVNNGNNNGSSWSPEVNNGNNNGSSWSPEVNNGGSSWSPEVNNGNNNGSSWSPEVNNNGSNSNTFKTTLKSKENELSTITENVKPVVEKLWQALSVHFLNIHDMKLPIFFGLIAIIVFAIVFDVPIWKTLIVYAIVIVFLMMMNWKSIDKNVPEDAASVIKEHFGMNQNTPIYIDEYNCVCQAPSPNNPCMNVLPYDNPYRPKGCNPTIPTIQERMNQYFYNNPAFINPKDIFGLHNDLHQWIPLPGSTIPEDREAWMRDAYRGMCSCKVNQQRCVDRVSWDIRRP